MVPGRSRSGSSTLCAVTTQLPRAVDGPLAEAPSTTGSVVGYDGSAAASAALQWAAQRARRSGTPLVVLSAADQVHAEHPDHLPSAPRGPGGTWEQARDVADEGARLAEAAGVSATPVAVLVGATRALLEASRHAESVVLARRGRGGDGTSRLGRTAFSVVDAASSPVVLVRGEPHVPGPHHPVVVGVDGSADAERAVRFAAAEAWSAGAPLELVSAWRPADGEPPGRAERTATAALRRATEAARAVAPGQRVVRRLVLGGADAVLARSAAGAGLLVVGACGRAAERAGAGCAARGLGTTAGELLGSAPCPVAVVR